MTDPWDLVAQDRKLMAELLGTLTAEQWAAPSLCADWSVREVAGHVLAMATVSKAASLAAYVRAGADLEATNDQLLRAAIAGHSDAEVAAAIAATAGNRPTPPGLRAEGVFGELVVHLADVALALDLPVELPPEHLTTTLAYLARRAKGNTRFTLTRHGRRPVLACQALVAGLRLEATDVAWTTGAGPVVRGPALALATAMAGRPGAVERLSGDGLEALRRRQSSSTTTPMPKP